jgi:hypothetical protein
MVKPFIYPSSLDELNVGGSHAFAIENELKLSGVAATAMKKQLDQTVDACGNKSGLVNVCEHSTMDTLVSFVVHWKSIDSKSKARMIDILSTIAQDVSHQTSQKTFVFQGDEALQLRNSLNLSIFLLSNIVIQSEAVDAQASLSRAGPKKSSGDWSWEKQGRKAVVTVLGTIVQAENIFRLWPASLPEEAFLLAFLRVGTTILSNSTQPMASADFPLLIQLFSQFLLPVKGVDTSSSSSSSSSSSLSMMHASACEALTLLALRSEASGSAVGNLLAATATSTKDNTPIVGLMEHILSASLAGNCGGDATALAKSIAAFLVAFTTGTAHNLTVLSATAEIILPFLGHDHYTVRNAVVDYVGKYLSLAEATNAQNPPEATAEKQANEGKEEEEALKEEALKEEEEIKGQHGTSELWELVLTRTRDAHAFTRLRTLNVLCALAEERHLPQHFFLAAVEGGKARLFDRSAIVRRAALHFLRSLLAFNPFAPCLHANALQSAALSPDARAVATQFAQSLTETCSHVAEFAIWRSSGVTDACEGLQFLSMAAAFEVPGGLHALTQAFPLIFHRESSIAAAALTAFHTFFLCSSEAGTAAAATQRLLAVVQSATVGVMTALQALVVRCVEEGLWTVELSLRLWREACQAHSAGALQLVHWSLSPLLAVEGKSSQSSQSSKSSCSLSLTDRDLLLTQALQSLKAGLQDGWGALIAGSMEMLSLLLVLLSESKQHEKTQSKQTQKANQTKTKSRQTKTKKEDKEDDPEVSESEQLLQSHRQLLLSTAQQLLAPPQSNAMSNGITDNWTGVMRQSIRLLYRLSLPKEAAPRLLTRLLQQWWQATLQQPEGEMVGKMLFLAAEAAFATQERMEEGREELARKAAASCVRRPQMSADATALEEDEDDKQEKHAQEEDELVAIAGGEASAAAEAVREQVAAIAAGPLIGEGLFAALTPLAVHVLSESLVLNDSSDSSAAAETAAAVAPVAVVERETEERYAAWRYLSAVGSLSPTFVEEHLALLLKIASCSPDGQLRMHAIVTLGDWITKFPHIVEASGSTILYEALTDPCLSVRRAGASVLSSLLLADMVKARGHISHLAKALVDDDSTVSAAAAALFQALAQKTGNPVYALLTDIFSTLSRDEHLEMEQFQEIMRFLTSLISLERHADSLVEKLTWRFRDVDQVEVQRQIAFTLSCLTLTERGVRRLLELRKCWIPALADEEVRSLFEAMAQKCLAPPKKNGAAAAAAAAAEDTAAATSTTVSTSNSSSASSSQVFQAFEHLVSFGGEISTTTNGNDDDDDDVAEDKKKQKGESDALMVEDMPWEEVIAQLTKEKGGKKLGSKSNNKSNKSKKNVAATRTSGRTRKTTAAASNKRGRKKQQDDFDSDASDSDVSELSEGDSDDAGEEEIGNDENVVNKATLPASSVRMSKTNAKETVSARGVRASTRRTRA